MTFHSTSLTTGSAQGTRFRVALTPLTFIFIGDLWGSSSTELSSPSLNHGEGKEAQNQSTQGSDSGKESKQMPAGKDRTFISEGIRFPLGG